MVEHVFCIMCKLQDHSIVVHSENLTEIVHGVDLLFYNILYVNTNFIYDFTEENAGFAFCYSWLVLCLLESWLKILRILR